MKIIQKRKNWFTLSGILVVLSILSLSFWGLNFGIDFTGGSLLEIEFSNYRPSVSDVRASLEPLDLGSLIVQPVEDQGMIFRFQDISEEKHQQSLDMLRENFGGEGNELVELRYDSIGPSIGRELKQKAFYSVIIVLIGIILFIAWSFRKVSKPLESWKYGLAAVVALFHDVILVLGLFSVLGEFYGVEVNSAFIAAILTVLGYSINDTIVVFDRIRENLPKSDVDFEATVNTSVNQTLVRSINVSLTTLLVLVSIILFGGATIRDFVLALALGVVVGTYSSIFLASPILVSMNKFKHKNL